MKPTITAFQRGFAAPLAVFTAASGV